MSESTSVTSTANTSATTPLTEAEKEIRANRIAIGYRLSALSRIYPDLVAAERAAYHDMAHAAEELIQAQRRSHERFETTGERTHVAWEQCNLEQLAAKHTEALLDLLSA